MSERSFESSRLKQRAPRLCALGKQEEPIGFRKHETYDRYFTKPVSMLRIAEALVEHDALRAIDSLAAAIARDDPEAAIAHGIDVRRVLAVIAQLPIDAPDDAPRRAELHRRAVEILGAEPQRLHGISQVERLLARIKGSAR